ncbi:MAG: hypothetical protein R3D88_08860 [Alphaproteobacteria bacterium]
MGLLKILGLRKDKTVKTPTVTVKTTETPTKNPHENGGCCGGCGSR